MLCNLILLPLQNMLVIAVYIGFFSSLLFGFTKSLVWLSSITVTFEYWNGSWNLDYWLFTINSKSKFTARICYYHSLDVHWILFTIVEVKSKVNNGLKWFSKGIEFKIIQTSLKNSTLNIGISERNFTKFDQTMPWIESLSMQWNKGLP